ncbi:MAG TPA: hypothetical protein VLW51_01545, partial [Solirubrobacteraceae bacterium]|nr:hypothetical protein [Solirubrobacteraceae bacterium]
MSGRAGALRPALGGVLFGGVSALRGGGGSAGRGGGAAVRGGGSGVAVAPLRGFPGASRGRISRHST